MRLPAEWVKAGLALADGATLFDVPFKDLTSEELIAAAAHGWVAEHKASISASEASVRHMNDLAEMAIRGYASDA